MRTLFQLGITILFLQAEPIQAQVSIGDRAGVSLFTSGFGASEDRTTDLLKKNTKNTIGISIGLPIEIMLGDHFALQPEIGYTMKGNKYAGSSEYEDLITLNYVDLTLLAKGRIGAGKVQGEVMLGPGLAYGLTARYRSTNPWYLSYFQDRTSDFPDTFLAPTEIFIAGGAGLSVALGVPRLILNYRYLYGITNIHSDDIVFTDINGATIDRIKEYNRGSIISLGFLIPLSRSAWAQNGDPTPGTPDQIPQR